MSTRIKICGLKRPQDIEAVNKADPDFAGFILEFPGSHRNISMKQLEMLRPILKDSIIPVGVFVNQTEDTIYKYTNAGLISAVQLHGNESDEFICRIKTMTNLPVIKAYSIRTASDVETAVKSPADMILLDQGSGGTGTVFDWSVLPGIERPWFLAGGLCRENIATAIAQVKPWGIDLSSGVETDRVKDEQKILDVVQTVRNNLATMEE